MSDSHFIINSTVANVYTTGDFNSSVTTQALLGETCDVLDETEKWVEVRQWDGYTGWVNKGQGVFSNEPYGATERFLDMEGRVITSDNEPIRNISFGSPLQVENNAVKLPDGQVGSILGNTGQFNRMPSRKSLCDTALRFLGVPYIWGGKSTYGFDCSGYIQTVFLANGIELVRDARKQIQMEELKTITMADVKPGDLYFFGKESITHVAMSTGGFGIVHAQGWVKKETLNPDDPDANSELIDMIDTIKSISGFLDK